MIITVTTITNEPAIHVRFTPTQTKNSITNLRTENGISKWQVDISGEHRCCRENR